MRNSHRLIGRWIVLPGVLRKIDRALRRQNNPDQYRNHEDRQNVGDGRTHFFHHELVEHAANDIENNEQRGQGLLALNLGARRRALAVLHGLQRRPAFASPRALPAHVLD